MKTENKEQKTSKFNVVIIAILLLSVVCLSLYQKYYWPKAEIFFGGQNLKVLVAKTQAQKFEGCSNKDDLGKYDGMIFVFQERSQHPMVMRDMRFSLDIVWLDNYVVVDMAKNLPTEPGKSELELIPYIARTKNDMVLELPAGFLDKNEVKIGDKLVVIR